MMKVFEKIQYLFIIKESLQTQKRIVPPNIGNLQRTLSRHHNLMDCFPPNIKIYSWKSQKVHKARENNKMQTGCKDEIKPTLLIDDCDC